MSEAVGMIYDTMVDPQRWGAALDNICTVVGAKACAILVRDHRQPPYEVSALSHVYREFIKTSEGQLYLKELRLHEAPDWEEFSRQPVGSPFPDSAVGITPAILDSRPDCVSLEHHLDVRRRLGVRLNDTPAWFDGLTMAFHRAQNEVPLSGIAPFVPHLARAIELGRTFIHLQAQYRAVLTVLDRVGAGLAIALPDGQIFVSNAEANRIISCYDGLWLNRQRKLYAASPEATERIQNGIASAAGTARGESGQTEISLQLKRHDHMFPLLLDITPLRDSGRELDVYLQGALITIIDPHQRDHLEISRFADLHGFSQAEREVCMLLIEGCSVTEIAELRGTAQTTVKNQIIRFLAKSGARSRFELIRKVVRTVPQFR